ncbi:MAG: cation-transporting P-type ATPase [Oscillospiraceae bacterium]
MKQKSKQPHLRVYRQIPMLQADPAEGLSPQETKLRQSNGLSNIMPPSNTKSEGQIIKENVLTFFNLIFLVLALCLCLVGSFKNLMFCSSLWLTQSSAAFRRSALSAPSIS